MKNICFKYLAIIIFVTFSVSNAFAQCVGCTVTGPSSGNYTFAANSVVCFTSNAVLGDVTFLNNSKICVAPGVTVIIQNNVSTSSNNNITFEIGGTLQVNQSSTISANLVVNVQNGGVLKVGPTGNGNFNFNGTNNTFNNNGTLQVGVLGFDNSNSTNVIDNYGTLTISSNINVKGTTTFRNWNLINVSGNYNNSATSKYINCGTFNAASGYNLGGGTVINTGTFNVPSGSIDISNGRLENYGVMYSGGSVNGGGGSSVFYNEGLAKLTNVQDIGSMKGPNSNNKLGYFYIINSINPNSSKIGTNLDFKRYTSYNPDVAAATQGQGQIFNSTPIYVNANGNPVGNATAAKVTFGCTSCDAPLVTSIGVCPNIDGSFPPQANDDSYSIPIGSNSSASVLTNDFVVYSGSVATTSNVSVSQVSTSNPGVSINSSGIVSVAQTTPSGIYTIVYRICSSTNSLSCDTATVTVTVIGSCTNPPATGAPASYTQTGISDIDGFTGGTTGWPANVPNGFIAIESRTKGFVITRVSSTNTITDPVVGMLVYDMSNSPTPCVKLYNGTVWKCIEKDCNPPTN